MINKEIRYFFTALMFFTRIPCPKWVDHDENYLNKSRKYFPLVGWIVGGIAAFILWLMLLILPLSISILISMIASVWVTGAFHEDGFTDVCDGFGGGWSKAQILTIMKDSRIGAYGVIGISLLFLLKFFLLFEIGTISVTLVLASIFTAHAISRFIASTFVHTHEYVQESEQSKAKPIASSRLSFGEMFYSFIFAALPLLLFWNYWLLCLSFLIAYAVKIYLGYYFNKHIGGYTGDCLGATQQMSEVVFYLAILALWKFI